MLSNVRHHLKKILFFILIAIVYGFSGENAIAAPLAILTDVTGGVSVTHNKKTSKGTIGTSLQAGDVVRVRSGKATIYYVTQAPRTLTAGQSAKVGQAARNVNSASTWRTVYKGVASGFARNKGSRLGTVRDGETMLVSPAGPIFKVAAPLTVSTDRPLFAWTKHKTAADYVVTLLKVTGKDFGDGAGEEIWNKTTQNTTFVYDGETPLEPGVIYKWFVTPRDKDLQELNRTPSLPFSIAPQKTIQAIQQQRKEILQALAHAPEETRRNAVAAMLIQNKLYAEAIATLAPELLKPRFLTAEFPKVEFKNLLKSLGNSGQKLLHNAFVGTNQQMWSTLIYSPPPVPGKIQSVNAETPKAKGSK